MVKVICEKTGIEFEAATRRTKNHPWIMGWLSDASKDGWYCQALATIKRGREQGFTTIDQFVADLRDVEAQYKAERDAAITEKNQRERDIAEARRQRAITNSLLRGRGYRWFNHGFRDEEEADAFSPNLPIGDDWQLYSPDSRPVTVQQAMQELAAQNVKFAIEWLTERGIAIVAPEPEPVEQMQARVKDTAETQAITEAIHDAHQKRVKSGEMLIQRAEQRAESFPDRDLYMRVFIKKYEAEIGSL